MNSLKNVCFIVLLAFANISPSNLLSQSFVEIKDLIISNPGLEEYWTGASWIDIDNDGDEDLFLTNRKPGISPRKNKLFINENGKFKPVTKGILVEDPGYWFGLSWGDYNNDGLKDLLVAGFPGALYKNLGDGNFEKIRGNVFDDPTFAGICVAWGDFNLDGHLDFILTRPEWIQGPPNSGQPASPKLMINSGPPSYSFSQWQGIKLGPKEKDTYMQPILSDYDDDGDLDIFIGMGSGAPKPDVMFQNLMKEKGSLDFKAITGKVISDDPIEGNQWCFEDIDNDGDLDAFVTNWANMVDNKAIPRPNNLYLNNNGVYQKITKGEIVEDLDLSSTASWGDYDNDGDLDLVVVSDSTYSLRYYENNGKGEFSHKNVGVLNTITKHQSGISTGDYDNDGDLDLFIPGPGMNNSLLKNELDNGHHWLKLDLVGTSSNKSAIGAKIWLKAIIDGKEVTQRREVSGANTFFGMNSLIQHFGLGNASSIKELKIIWPTGKKELFKVDKLNALQKIIEGKGFQLIQTNR